MTAASLLGLGAILGAGLFYTRSIAGDDWSQTNSLAATVGAALGWAGHWLMSVMI